MASVLRFRVPMWPGPGGFANESPPARGATSSPVPSVSQATNAPPALRMAIPMRVGAHGFTAGVSPRGSTSSAFRPQPDAGGGGGETGRRRRRL